MKMKKLKEGRARKGRLKEGSIRPLAIGNGIELAEATP